MRLLTAKLQNFRNHSSFEVLLPRDNNTVVLKGQNGTGKTSFLEAIHYLSFLKSFRTNSLPELIQWEKEYFRLEAQIAPDHSEKSEMMEAFFGIFPYDKRVTKINEIERKAVEFAAHLKVILFTPRDLLMLTDEPGLRRAYLNRLLIQANSGFLALSNAYQKVLKQRNSLLKTLSFSPTPQLLSELEVWDGELAKYGSQIVALRQKAVNFLNANAASPYAEISAGSRRLGIEYQSNASADEAEFLQKIKKALPQDKRYQVSNVGHRDDVLYFLDDKNVKFAASQGELRSVVLALKLVEADYIEKETLSRPILLFDDVFSELDLARQLSLVESLKGHQVLISAAEEHCLAKIEPKAFVVEM